jgi:hypothetical protein
MPQIPVYTQQTVPRGTQAIPQQPDLTRDAFIAGASIQRATDAWARKLDADGAAWAGAELAKTQAEWDKQFIDRQQSVQPGAPDFTKTFVDDFRTYRKETLARAPTDTARGYLGQRLDALEQQLYGAALKFEAEEGLRNRVRLNEQAIDAKRLSVARHPEKFPEFLAETRASLDASNLTPAERDRLYDLATQGLAADSLITLAQKNPQQLLYSLYAEPGKSGNAAIEALTAEGRKQMISFVQGQFESLVKAQEAQAAMEAAARKEVYEKNERVFTAAYLQGRLGKGDLVRALEVDAIDPTLARTLANEMESDATGGEPPETTQALLFALNANLLALTEDDIRNAPIPFKEKIPLLEKYRERVSGWGSTPEAKEAMARIDRELGFVPGTPTATLSQDDLRRRGRAMTELYNRVQSLPPDPRQTAVIGVAEEVVETVLKTQQQRSAQKARAQLDVLRKKDVSGMGAAERAAHDSAIQRLEAIASQGQ